MRIIKLSGTFFFLLVIFCSFSLNMPQNSGSSLVKSSGGFPEEITAILTNSCYDCHTTESQNKSASFALDFKKWDEYKDAKKSQLLIKIDEVVTDKSMPPKKYLDDYPCKTLSDDQVKLVSKWTKEESAKLGV